MSPRAVPAGYERVAVGKAVAVVPQPLAAHVRQLLTITPTLYDAARHHPEARELHGRQPAYAVPAPDGDGWMVVRHNRHGGLLAGLTGDLFLTPTRAPYELETSRRLAGAGVPTPEMLGYVRYSVGGLFARSDVVTRLVEPSRDLSAVLATDDPGLRGRALELTATLVASLSRAGARHHDLNAKNVLIADQAMVLDVDRVAFGWKPEDALAANLARLDRSLRKRRARFGEQISDEEIGTLGRWAAERM